MAGIPPLIKGKTVYFVSNQGFDWLPYFPQSLVEIGWKLWDRAVALTVGVLWKS